MARVAVVTGGTRGIGAAIAVALKQAGYVVAANYAGNDERAKAFSDETGVPVFKFDVSDFEQCRSGIQHIGESLGVGHGAKPVDHQHGPLHGVSSCFSRHRGRADKGPHA